MDNILIYSIVALVLVAALVLICYLICTRKSITIENTLGKKCIVTVEVNNFAGRGQVRVGGETFSCRTLFDEDLFEVGERVVVVAVEGPKLVCKRI